MYYVDLWQKKILSNVATRYNNIVHYYYQQQFAPYHTKLYYFKFWKKYKHKHNMVHTMKKNTKVYSSTKKEIYEIRT
jgi:hypothetical protein